MEPQSLAIFIPLDERPCLVKDDERYKCVVCHRIIVNPYQTECGHRGCCSCFDDLLRSADTVACPVGESDCGNISKSNMFPDKSFGRELGRLEVFCPYRSNGCREKMKYVDVSNHLEKCVSRHQVCPQCKNMVPNQELENHLNNECPESQLACPNGCGVTKLTRKELSNHQKECTKQPKPCMFQPVGCLFEADDATRREHESQNHWPLIIIYLAELKMKLSNDNSMGEASGGASAGDHRSHSDMQQELQPVKHLVERFTKKVNELEKTVAKQNEIILSFTEGSTTPAAQGSNDTDRAMIKDLQATVRTLSNKLSTLESTSATEGAGKLRQAENEITLHSVRLAEMDLRVQGLEAASYDGRLLWKIADYRKKKSDAVAGKTTSIYSQAFYTSRFGYKMCARIYLNGDGMGKNTHMSLFFVVMRGEFDQLLPWPFKQKVTFQLIDTEMGVKHISDSFRPDPSSTSFKRPTSDMNIASGCPLFVPQQTVETPTYYNAKEDCIFLKIIVDSAGIDS